MKGSLDLVSPITKIDAVWSWCRRPASACAVDTVSVTWRGNKMDSQHLSAGFPRAMIHGR